MNTRHDFRRQMVESYSVAVVCAECGDEMDVELSGDSFDSAAALLNRDLNEYGWTLKEGDVLCPDCQKEQP